MIEDVADLELELLLDGICRRWSYDFRGYGRASLKRRVKTALASEGIDTISELQAKVLRDRAALERFVSYLSVHVTSMFRDPEVYLAIRTRVAPILRTYPFLRVWHAGCSSGEEVYSLAIVLAEEGLLDRALLYATDISDVLVQRAKRGVFPLESMKKNTRNYHQAGGRADFSDYWVADQRNAVMRDSLRKNLVFSRHSLVSDGSFNEFHVIFCRNVIIYFNQELRRRVHQLLYDSLGKFGLIVLGLKETMDFTPHAAAYERFDGNLRIYRRIK